MSSKPNRTKRVAIFCHEGILRKNERRIVNVSALPRIASPEGILEELSCAIIP